MSPPPKVATGERTMRVSAPVFHRSGKVWRDFKFTHLEKVTGAQKLLAKRLEWLLPGLNASGVASEAVRERLKLLFEEEVRLSVEYVHVISPKALKKHVGDPTFLGVVAPVPHKTRGLLEVELALAHTAIDMLLGGAGETVALRPLTEIEEGVMTYVLIETLKALSPHLDPGLPRLRLEGLIRGVDEALSLLSEEAQVAVVQLKCVLGGQSGYLRLFIPASVLAMTQPPPEAEARRAKRAADFAAHRSRLAGVKAWLRAEIGYAAVTSADLVQLRDRDVVLVDQLTVRPDQGGSGTGRLKVGAGRAGWVDADLVVEEGRYKAKVTGFSFGEPEQVSEADEGDEQSTGEELEHLASERGPVDQSMHKAEGGELLNDIPLQIAVELARVSITAEEVVALKVGEVLDLNRVPGEPVELSVNGKVVARGELVEVEGHLGVRVLSLAG